MDYIGIDLGTSFLKGAILDVEKCTLRSIHREPFPESITSLDPLVSEVRPNAVVDATRRLLERLGELTSEPAGVVMCSQMHGMVLTDGNGQAMSNVITWQDQRSLQVDENGVRYFDRLSSRLDEQVVQQLGNGIKPSLPLCVLDWMANTGVQQAGWMVCSLPDYVMGRLSDMEAAMEPTMAASMGAYDIVSGDWHAEAIQLAGASELRWPQIRPFDYPAYTVRIGGTETPCYVPVGDHQCAILGSLTRESELSINISTGSQVSLIADSWQPGEYEVRPFFERRYLKTISRIPAGRALNLLMDLLLALPNAAGAEIKEPWEIVRAQVDALDNTDLEVELSFFATMFGDEGHIRHIREDNFTPGHLFRAAFQTMAGNYWTCANRISPARDWSKIVFSGGLASRFSSLRAQIEREFKTQGRMSPTQEDTLLGLLVLATVVSGQAESIDRATELVGSRFSAPPQ